MNWQNKEKNSGPPTRFKCIIKANCTSLGSYPKTHHYHLKNGDKMYKDTNTSSSHSYFRQAVFTMQVTYQLTYPSSPPPHLYYCFGFLSFYKIVTLGNIMSQLLQAISEQSYRNISQPGLCLCKKSCKACSPGQILT